LKCGQRNKGEKLPGLTGFEKFEGKGGKDANKDGDYCYDPDWNKKFAEYKKAKADEKPEKKKPEEKDDDEEESDKPLNGE
jgi:hypothetical protein